MNRKIRPVDSGIESDPYGEGAPVEIREAVEVLGGRFYFESNSKELLALVDAAYAGLPSHLFSSTPKTFRIKLMLTPAPAKAIRRGTRTKQPPPISMLQGAGFLGSATPASTFVVTSTRERAGLVSVSRDMLRFPYHVRYEAIEFAVFTLACRAQGLVPLHAACVGLGGLGVLLMGSSGAGKSTVALQSLFEGFEFLSEDSVFVAPKSMRATGAANFLHIRADSLRWIGATRARSIVNRSPVIQRRSGVKKFELDLRGKQFRLANHPVKIVQVAFLSPRSAGAGPQMRVLSRAETLERLTSEQGYAAGLPQWQRFARNMLQLGGVEIFRGDHPRATVEVLRSLLRHGITRSPRSPA